MCTGALVLAAAGLLDGYAANTHWQRCDLLARYPAVEVIRMSERHFSRAFHAETGTTPAVHVEELRVEAARRLLETTDLTVAAVARRVGLTHAETLHRAFARRVGTTPARYRQHFARTPAY